MNSNHLCFCGKPAVGCARGIRYEYDEETSLTFGKPTKKIVPGMWHYWCEEHAPESIGFSNYWQKNCSKFLKNKISKDIALEIWEASRKDML